MSSLHTSVLLNETVDGLVPQSGGIYLDATCGLGGHSEALLQACGPTGQVISMDRDPEALAHAERRLHAFGDRSHRVQGSFSAALSTARHHGYGGLDGVMADLGVSSLQLDKADRGFSFMRDGPLDMRMGPEVGLTAKDILDQISYQELSNILHEYGEERNASRVARAIIRARDHQQLNSTSDLAAVVERALGGRRGAPTHPATRTFQALRIAVNRELEELELFLEQLRDLVRPGGRVAIISFHSLEDRLVKHAFAEPKPIEMPRGLPIEPVRVLGPWRVITKKPIIPSQDEQSENPRARSAKLRIAERRAPATEGEGDE